MADNDYRRAILEILDSHRPCLDWSHWTCGACPNWRSRQPGWNAQFEIREHQADLIIAALGDRSAHAPECKTGRKPLA